MSCRCGPSKTIREQLDAGVRALLIATHYWTAVVSAEQLAEIDRTVPAEVVRRTFDPGGDRLRAQEGVFVCHNHCVRGGEPLRDGLAQVRDFLDDNPDDVVTLVVEDETSVDDTVAVLREVGLDRFVYTHDPGDDWPTLGELVDTSQRLVVFAEHEGAATRLVPIRVRRHPRHTLRVLEPRRDVVRTEPGPSRRAAPVDEPLGHDRRAGPAYRGRRQHARLSNIGDVVGAVAALNGVD